MNLWVYAPLPYTSNGITFSADREGGVHAHGTTNTWQWAIFQKTIELPAGRYSLARTIGGASNLYAEAQRVDGSVSINMSGVGDTSVEADFPAGPVMLRIVVPPNAKLDGRIVPFLERVG